MYCIANVANGKIYIGSTGNSFYARYHQHVSDYKKGKHNGVALKRAFDKHGIENFSFSIVCICSEKERLILEQFYINQGVDYNTAMIAGSLLGVKHSPLSKTRTIRGGLHHTAKVVFQFKLDGSLIKKHLSFIEALTEIGKTKKGSSHITSACQGKTFSAFGYRWSYTEELYKREKREGGKDKVLVEKGEIIKIFDSQVSASEYIKSFGHKCSQARIARSLKLTSELVYGFKLTKI